MKKALLVIDVQNVYFAGKLPVTYPPGSLENILQAMDTARERGVPIAVIQHRILPDSLSSALAQANGSFILRLQNAHMTF
ncbi:MAG: isochorismatase family protein [Nitrospiraceae bacterium]|nr:isochorismatase family protein [Nitrospiraceae bacterium]